MKKNDPRTMRQFSPDLGEEPEWEFDEGPFGIFEQAERQPGSRPQTGDRIFHNIGEEIVRGRRK